MRIITGSGRFATALFIISCLVVGCTYKKLATTSIYNRYIHEDKAIVVSCTRCGCVDDYFKFNRTSQYKGIKIMGDTNCVPFTKYHIQTSALDSIFQANYNVVLFKKKGEQVFYEILKTEDAMKFTKTINSFFDMH